MSTAVMHILSATGSITFPKSVTWSVHLAMGPSNISDKNIANIIPNEERYNQINLCTYSGYPIRSNGLTTLEIRFLEWAAIRFK